jgi:large subunit ribosomal protein L15
MARAGHGGPGGGKPGFEGGQMKITRRIPKRGFTNPFRVESQVVSLDDLTAIADGAEVTRETLAEAGVINLRKGPPKILGNGELARAVVVRGVKVSAGARSRIEAAGGRIED